MLFPPSIHTLGIFCNVGVALVLDYTGIGSLKYKEVSVSGVKLFLMSIQKMFQNASQFLLARHIFFITGL